VEQTGKKRGKQSGYGSVKSTLWNKGELAKEEREKGFPNMEKLCISRRDRGQRELTRSKSLEGFGKNLEDVKFGKDC